MPKLSPPLFNVQFLDDDGTPLDGGYLYTYAAGTTTPQATYVDQDGVEANTNPIELDSAGRCLLWLNDDAEYTFVLKRADLTTVWTRDDIAGVGIGTSVASVNGETGVVVLEADDIGFTTATSTTWFAGTDNAAALDAIITKVDAIAASLASTISGLNSVPTGAVVPFGGSAVPTGWLECNGQAVSRTTYAALFTAIGTTAGVGNGTTTFNVPDLRGEFVRGWDNGRAVDAGRALMSTQATNMAAHVHLNGISNTLDNIFVYGGTTTGMPGSATHQVEESSNPATYQGPTSSTGSGTETYPRNVALMYCIRT
jgi:microcystin-dependent protein